MSYLSDCMMAASNYSDVLAQFRNFGLDVEAPEIGKLTRCRTADDRRGQKSGFYALFEIQTEAGDTLLVGSYGDWRQGGDAHKVALSRKQKLTPDERAAIRTRMAEDRKRARAARKRRAEQAAARAVRMWRDQCFPMGPATTHPYLTDKNVPSYDSRLSRKGALVFTVCDARGTIHGLHLILDRILHAAAIKRLGRNKLFHPAGMEKRGHFHLLGAPRPGGVLLVAEGYATAATLREATDLPVAVAFDAGNLAPAAEALCKHYKGLHIMICADDDYLGRCSHCKKQVRVAESACPHCGELHGRINPGIVKASAAAVAVSGAFVAPSFSDRNGRRLTDFNDLAQAEGLHVVRSQIEARLFELGWMDAEAAKSPHQREGEAAPASIFTADELLRRLSLIQFNDSTAFDHETHEVVKLQDVRDLCADKQIVREWQARPDRKVVRKEDIVFDPGGDTAYESYNLWAGLDMVPKAGRCDALLDVLRFLCSREKHSRDVFDWIVRWIAYPLQMMGTKMQTALAFHGPEGTGKNLFFGAVADIYGRYALQFGQELIEDRFNDPFSAKQFAIGNEVVSRAEFYHLPGRLKTLITEPVILINPKGKPKRQERNACNLLFFSNRPDILKLDADDRRFLVVNTPEPAGPDFYADAAEELADGGAAALYYYLLNVDLGDFGPHTKPLKTAAKSALIELTKDNPERFWDAWAAGALACSFMPCTSADLYALYRRWCATEGERWPLPRNKFSAIVKRFCVDGEIKQKKISGKNRQIILPKACECPVADAINSWITECVHSFARELEDGEA